MHNFQPRTQTCCATSHKDDPQRQQCKRCGWPMKADTLEERRTRFHHPMLKQDPKE
jgi:hypothetical protein